MKQLDLVEPDGILEHPDQVGMDNQLAAVVDTVADTVAVVAADTAAGAGIDGPVADTVAVASNETVAAALASHAVGSSENMNICPISYGDFIMVQCWLLQDPS